VIVDTYGGFCPHGGGAFSGKDPTKVDRSATYMCRHVAKCIVAAGLAERALVSVAYAIGMADPVQITVDTFGTNQVDEKKLEALVRERFPFKPREIERYLQLRSGKFLYRDTARNGHFGAKPFPWEDTSAAKDLLV
jgi:S-adenosylmethionine synthetase